MISAKPQLNYSGAYSNQKSSENATLTGTLELFALLRHWGGAFPTILPVRAFLLAVDRSKTQFEQVDVTPTLPPDLPPSLPLNYQIELPGSHTISVADVANSMFQSPSGLLGLLQQFVPNPDAPDKPLEQLDLEHAFISLNPTLSLGVQSEIKSWIDPFMSAMGG